MGWGSANGSSHSPLRIARTKSRADPAPEGPNKSAGGEARNERNHRTPRLATDPPRRGGRSVESTMDAILLAPRRGALWIGAKIRGFPSPRSVHPRLPSLVPPGRRWLFAASRHAPALERNCVPRQGPPCPRARTLDRRRASGSLPLHSPYCPTRYRCVFVRRMRSPPLTAGEAMKPASNWFSASTSKVGPAFTTVQRPTSSKA